MILMGLLVGAVTVLGAMAIVLVVVMSRRKRKAQQVAAQRPSARRPAPEVQRSVASMQPPLKRRLPGVAATDAYAVVPQRTPNVWFRVPPKTMDFSDVDN